MDINIKAIRQARRRGADVGLLICGDGEQRKELEELTAKLSLEPYVSFLGMRDDVPDVMKGCNAFCHAAPFEPFGIVCIEAMATGLPVIIPDTGGMKEAVISSENGFIYKSLDEKEMSEKMIDLAAIGSEERKRMGKKNRQRVLEHFTVEQYVKKLYQIYGLASNE
jgi:glycosyltransferase involved in cell wall biosynthesis